MCVFKIAVEHYHTISAPKEEMASTSSSYMCVLCCEEASPRRFSALLVRLLTVAEQYPIVPSHRGIQLDDVCRLRV